MLKTYQNRFDPGLKYVIRNTNSFGKKKKIYSNIIFMNKKWIERYKKGRILLNKK